MSSQGVSAGVGGWDKNNSGKEGWRRSIWSAGDGVRDAKGGSICYRAGGETGVGFRGERGEIKIRSSPTCFPSLSALQDLMEYLLTLGAGIPDKMGEGQLKGKICVIHWRFGKRVGRWQWMKVRLGIWIGRPGRRCKNLHLHLSYLFSWPAWLMWFPGNVCLCGLLVSLLETLTLHTSFMILISKTPIIICVVLINPKHQTETRSSL